MIATLQHIFSQPRYIVVACLLSLFIYVVVAWINNGDFLYVMITSESFGIWTKIQLTAVGLWAVWSIIGVFSFICVIVLSVLFGIYGALFYYWIQKSKKVQVREMGRGAWGAILGFVGLGCSVCGTLVITPFLTSMGVAGMLTVLPLHGAEFLLLAIVWMCVSIYFLLKKIEAPLVCIVDEKNN